MFKALNTKLKFSRYLFYLMLSVSLIALQSAQRITADTNPNAHLIISANETSEDNYLTIYFEGNGVSAFSFQIEYSSDETLEFDCDTFLSEVKCNHEVKTRNVRANFLDYSISNPLNTNGGRIALLEMPYDCADSPEISIHTIKFYSASLEPIDVSVENQTSCTSFTNHLFLPILNSHTTSHVNTQLPTLPEEQPNKLTESTLGDANCDSKIDIFDALSALHLGETATNTNNQCPTDQITEIHTSACNVNLDGLCNIDDVEILRMCDIGVGIQDHNNQVFCDPDRIPDEYIVTINLGQMTPSDLFVEIEQNGGEPIHEYDSVMSGVAAKLPPKALVVFEPQDFSIFFDKIIGEHDWGRDRIDQRSPELDGIYNPKNNGEGVHVYIVDSGIRATHIEFDGRIGSGFSAIGDPNDLEDCTGHGTHVTGIIGGATFGVANQVILHPVRIIDCNEKGNFRDLIRALDWIAEDIETHDHEPAVINLSVGGSGKDSQNRAVKNAIETLTSHDINVVVAAGNDRTSYICNKPLISADGSITVGATTIRDERWIDTNFGRCIDIFAPGQNVFSAGYLNDTASETKSGTSMAAPHVTGAVAIFLAMNPDATSTEVKNAIINNATDYAIQGAGTESPNKLLRIPELGGGRSQLSFQMLDIDTLLYNNYILDVDNQCGNPTPLLTPPMDNLHQKYRFSWHPYGNMASYQIGTNTGPSNMYFIKDINDPTSGGSEVPIDIRPGHSARSDWRPRPNENQYILYQYAETVGGQYDLYSASMSEPYTIKQLTDEDDLARPAHRGIRWSPDGNKVAFTASDGYIYLVTITEESGGLKAGEAERIVEGLEASWSPDGTHLVYYSLRDNSLRHNIFIVEISTKAVTQITFQTDDDSLSYREPDWSPDGTLIAFTGNHRDIFIVEPDGSNLQNLTCNSVGWRWFVRWRP